MGNNSGSHYKVGSTLLTLLVSVLLTSLSYNTSSAQVGQSSTDEISDATVKNVDVQTFDALRKDRAYVKIDVRTPDEMIKGKLGGALEIDFESPSFVSELEKLDKEGNYLVFSNNGMKSAKAVRKMVDLGFTNVFNLQGGYTLWEAADRPPE